jgi:hypothetical protein
MEGPDSPRRAPSEGFRNTGIEEEAWAKASAAEGSTGRGGARGWLRSSFPSPSRFRFVPAAGTAEAPSMGDEAREEEDKDEEESLE